MDDKDMDDEPYNPLDPKSVQRKREKEAELERGRPKPTPVTDYSKKFSKPFTSDEQRKAQLAREEMLRKRKFPELDEK